MALWNAEVCGEVENVTLANITQILNIKNPLHGLNKSPRRQHQVRLAT